MTRPELSPNRSLRDAAFTLAAVLLAFAAFDDITTDSDSSFTTEWAALVLCGAWLLVVGLRLAHGTHRQLGYISLAVLMAAVVGGMVISTSTGPLEIAYLTTTMALVWFLGVAVHLARQAWRPSIGTYDR